MAFLDHNGESEFPFLKDKVFDAMCLAIPTIKGMKIENADKLQGRILVKASVSLWSWGENIPIQLSELSNTKTKVQITSSPKTGILFGGAFDMGKNRKNIEQILSSTSRILSNPQQITETTVNENSSINKSNNLTTQNSNLMEQNNNTSNAWYEKTWLVILLCVIFFPVGLYALWKNSSIGKGWKIGVTAIIALIIIANIGNKDDKTTSASSSNNTTSEETTTVKTPENESNWRYSEDIDQMDNTKRTVASIESDNSIKFDFPYGNSDFTLSIRNWKGQTDLYLTCTKCQFIAGVMGETTYRIKFDDEAPINVSANHSTSGGADVVFLGNEKKVISKLKTAEKIILEAQFYEAGYKQINFSTKGLKWD
jgi:hypothetical protein